MILGPFLEGRHCTKVPLLFTTVNGNSAWHSRPQCSDPPLFHTFWALPCGLHVSCYVHPGIYSAKAASWSDSSPLSPTFCLSNGSSNPGSLPGHLPPEDFPRLLVLPTIVLLYTTSFPPQEWRVWYYALPGTHHPLQRLSGVSHIPLPFLPLLQAKCVKAHSRPHVILPSASQTLLQNLGIILCSHSADVGPKKIHSYLLVSPKSCFILGITSGLSDAILQLFV